MDRSEIEARVALDEATHTYTHDGVIVPGVTWVLAANGFYEFPFVSAEDLAAKQLLGRRVHKATALHDSGTLDWASIANDVFPYVESYLKFRDEHPQWVVLENEQVIYHALLRYAGTLDRVFDASGIATLLDIKIGAELPAARLQTAAYEAARDYDRKNGERVRVRASLHLTTHSSYRLVAHDDPGDTRAFFSCLNLYHWRKSS